MYVTNLKCSGRYIVKRYAKRWIIETDYRCIGVFEAVSNSRIPQTRILLYSLAMVLDALWVIASTLSKLKKKGNEINMTEETLFDIL